MNTNKVAAKIASFDAALVKVMPLLSAQDRAAVEAARALLIDAAAQRRASSIETFLYAAAVAAREELAHA